MMTSHSPLFRRTLPLFAIGLAAACTDATSPGADDPDPSAIAVAIQGAECRVAGVNANPFTIESALSANVAAHDTPTDYTWNAGDEVSVTLSDAGVTIGGPGATVSGSTVTISAAGTYRLSGSLTNGQVVVKASGALVRLILAGVTIGNASDSPLLVSKAAKAVVILAEGTVNRLTDGPTYPDGADQNAALFSDDNLSIGGTGSLTVEGRFNDGIASKNGLVIASGRITVSAVDDGIRGKDYLIVRDGTLAVTAGGDGLKSDEDEDVEQGWVLVEGGTIGVVAGGDGIQAETDALVGAGTLTLKSGGGATVTIADSLSAKGIKGGVLVVVDGGTVAIDAADDGLHSNADLIVNGGATTIASADDGVHADAELVFNAGDVTVTRSYEGIENTLADLTFNGGRIRVASTDDAINLAGNGDTRPGSGASPYLLRINGGRIVATSGGDGVDANGSIVMTGGCLLVHGPTVNNNAPIDYDGSFQLTGGLLVAAGSSGMAQAPGTTSTQPALLLTLSSAQPAGTIVHLQTSAGVGIVDFAPSKAFQSVAISAPGLVMGGAYQLFLGGSATSDPTDGWYESGTYTAGTLARTLTVSSMVTR